MESVPEKRMEAFHVLEEAKGVFAEVAATTDHSESFGPRYGLTEVSKLLVTGSEFDLIPFVLLGRRTGGFAGSLKHLCETVEDDADGFELANGMDIWSYAKANPSFNAFFNEAMRSGSKLPNNIIAHHYEGFKDVKCLVDVGGGVGGALAVIVAAHPHISGTNFDLPHVVSSAPTIPGVEHISGNFLEFVSSGPDTILLQHVLHDWDFFVLLFGVCGTWISLSLSKHDRILFVHRNAIR